MRRLFTIGFIGLLSLSLILTGCSSNKKGTTPSAGAQPKGMTKVSMVYWPGPESDAMQKVVDTYNNGQGKTDGVVVKMVLLSRDGTYEKEATMMNSKSAEVDMYYSASYIISQHAPYLEPLNDKVKTDNYLKSSVESLKIDGNLLIVPTDVSNHFLFYRKDLIDKLLSDAGWQSKYKEVSQKAVGKSLSPKDPKDWDWEDFTAAAAFFTQSYNADSPTKYGTGLQLKNLIFNVSLWDDVLWSSGGSWTDSSGKVQLDNAAAKKAMEIYTNIYKNKMTSPNSSVAEYPETQAAFQSGSIAFALQWSAAYDELNDPKRSPDIAGKIAVAPIPGGHKTHVESLGVALNKYSKNKEASLKWMNYLTTVESMKIYAEAGGIPPIGEVLNSLGDKKPVLPMIAEHIDKYGFSEPLNQMEPIEQKLAEVFSAAWVGQQDVDKAIQKAQTDVSALLAK